MSGLARPVRPARTAATASISPIHGSRNRTLPPSVARGASGRTRRPKALSPWNGNDAQPWAVFHTATGISADRAIAAAIQGCGRRSHCRWAGCVTTAITAPPRTGTAAYPDSMARPAQRPAPIHHAIEDRRDGRSACRRHRAKPVNAASSGPSGRIQLAVAMPNDGARFRASAAAKPARAEDSIVAIRAHHHVVIANRAMNGSRRVSHDGPGRSRPASQHSHHDSGGWS